MSSPSSNGADPGSATAQLASKAEEIAALASSVLTGAAIQELPDEAVQQLLIAGVKLFVAKREMDSPITPFPKETLTATDVAIMATAMTRAVDLELFELALWTGWGTT